jgi:hypothetical protein
VLHTLLCQSYWCWKVYSTSYTIFRASSILSYITDNLGSSGIKMFVAESKMVCLQKKKKKMPSTTLNEYVPLKPISTHVSFRWKYIKRQASKVAPIRMKFSAQLPSLQEINILCFEFLLRTVKKFEQYFTCNFKTCNCF